MIGSSETGQCALLDPLWDIEPYLEIAKQKGSAIRYVIASHTHADHVSGARRIASATNAELVLSTLADITYEATWVNDRDTLHLGEISLNFIHIPGHRPELMNLLITDHARGDVPWCILTADSLIVGDLAPPIWHRPVKREPRNSSTGHCRACFHCPTMWRSTPATLLDRPEDAFPVASLSQQLAMNDAALQHFSSPTALNLPII